MKMWKSAVLISYVQSLSLIHIFCDKSLKLGFHCLHSGLLQHNLRHPCLLSIVLISPWKNPLIIPVPFYQRPHDLFKYHNLSFPRLFTVRVAVHSVLSNAAKIHFRLPAAIGLWPVCHFITKQRKTLIHKKDRTHFTVSRSFLLYSLFFTF